MCMFRELDLLYNRNADYHMMVMSNQDSDPNSEEELPEIFTSRKTMNSNDVINLDDEPECTKMVTNDKPHTGEKNHRRIPYSKNDFLSDSSDIDNDVEILEPRSLKDRLLEKQVGSSNGSSVLYTSGLIDLKLNQFPVHKNSDFTERVKALEADPCEAETNLYSVKISDIVEKTSQLTKPASEEDSCMLDSLPKITMSEKACKRKRTPEEIEEKKKQAQIKKEETEKKKLERERVQLEKKKNIQIRKLEGERKKQMGAWNQSLEFIKIVLDPHLINDCGLGAAIFKAGEDLKVPCITEEQGLPFTITWKRTVTEWVETASQVEAMKKEIVEDTALNVIPVSDFVQMVENYKQRLHGDATALSQYIQIIQHRQPGVSVTPVVIGLEKYFREIKTTQQRQHREAVLATGQSLEKTKTKKHFNTEVSRLDVEEAVTDAQLLTGCVVQMLDTPEDITDLVRSYTKAVAEKPSKKDRLNTVFSFHEDGTTGVKVDKSGHGLLKVWKQQLLQFKNVSPDIAEAIIAEYPSPRLLMKAYDRCNTQEEGVKILENIVVRRGAGVLETTRRVGKEMSRRFYSFFTNTDATFTIK